MSGLKTETVQEEKLAQSADFPNEKLVLSRDELLALVEEAVSERMTRIAAPKQEAAFDIGESIAMHTAELVNQGVGKRAPIDPKVLKNRRLSDTKMRAAIAEAIATGDLPHYQVMNTCFLGGTLVGPDPLHDTIIEWRSAPNGAMKPVNEPAKRIFSLFQQSIGYDDEAPVPEGYGSADQGKLLKYISGGPAPSNIVEIGKQHSGEDLKIVQGGPPMIRQGDRLVNKLATMNLR